MEKPVSKVEELREALKAKKEAEAKTEKAPEPANEAEDVLASIRAAEEDAKQHYDKLLRVMAEFENFKKRVGREQEEKVKFANERLMLEILPALDDLDRVLDHVAEDASPEVKAIADGVGLVRRALYNALSKFGLSEIEALDKPFDPAMHEAVSCIEDNEREDNSIIAVHRKGYKLEDRVIRAAQVIVTKKGRSNA